jgi:oligosaccharide repeat unit polymerase
MLYILVFILFIVAIISMKIFIKTKTINPIFTCFLGITYFIFYPYFILVLNNGYTSPSYFGIMGYWGDIDINIMSLYPFVFLFIFLFVFYSLIILNKKSILLLDGLIFSKLLKFNINCLKRILNKLIIFSIFILIYFVIDAGGIEAYLSQSFHSRQEHIADNSEILYLLIQNTNKAFQVLIVSISILYVNVLYAKDISNKKYIFFLLGYQLIGMIGSGNRIYFVILILMILSILIMYKDKKNLIKVFFVLPIFISGLIIWTSIRSNIFDSLDRITSLLESIDPNPIVTALLNMAEGMNVIVLLHIIEDFGVKYDFLYGLNYIKLFIIYIPRSFLPEKPIDFTSYAAKLYEPASIGFSLNSTFLGEMYANIGDILILFLPLFFILFIKLSFKVAKLNIIILYILSFSTFWMIRVTFVETIISIIFSILFYYLINKK